VARAEKPHAPRAVQAFQTDLMRISRIFTVYGLSAALVCGYKCVPPLSKYTKHTAMAAKFYFYFFWYLRPLADREG
jgi:hypothetical protein